MCGSAVECARALRVASQVPTQCLTLWVRGGERGSLLNQTLDHGVGEKYVYSDLSMITLSYVIGTIARDNALVAASHLNPGCASGGDGT